MSEERGGRGRGGAKGKDADKSKGGDRPRGGFFRRRRVCKFCAEKIDYINYKDVRLLAPFLPERGKIQPRRISGTCALHQRKLQTAIKRARQLALIPYVRLRCRACERARAAQPVRGTKHMEVILREHIDNLGRRGDVVKVAAGYARNYLLPRKLALAVTESNKRQIEREKKVAEVRDAEEKTQAEALAQRLEAIDIEIARRVGENNTLYGSVTSADIAHALEAKGFQVDKRKITLAEPLKAIGEVTVPVKIHRDVTAKVKVKVVPEAQ